MTRQYDHETTFNSPGFVVRRYQCVDCGRRTEYTRPRRGGRLAEVEAPPPARCHLCCASRFAADGVMVVARRTAHGEDDGPA